MAEILRTIDKSELPKLFESESKHSTVYAPSGGDGFAEMSNGSTNLDAVFTPGQPRLSPKSFFFPQTETLYRFDYDSIVESEEKPVEPMTLFAVRPCDAASFELLDQVFGSSNHGFSDPYYARRREAVVVISLACTAPCGACFCESVGGDLAGKPGADVLAHDLGDSVLMEGVSDRGTEFLERNADLLAEGTGVQLESAREQARDTRSDMSAVTFDRDTMKKNLDDRFDDPAWDGITNSCIGCGACTYLCPTCHCFDICDEERLYKGCRIRTWDSCQYANFTKHASGHNPRPTKIERLRQRFMHKFSYTVSSVDEVYCVGCGRCVNACPINLDIREVMGEFSS